MSAPLPYLPPQPGTHHAGRTVVPLPPTQPVVVVPHQALPAEAMAAQGGSVLEEAARELAVAPAEPAPPAAVPVPEPPRTAAACMTVLPR